MPELVSWLRGLPQPVVLAVAAVLVVAEAGLLIGVVLPGATALLALGVLARLGVTGLPVAIAVAAVAAVGGTQLGYRRGPPTRLAGPTRRARELLRRSGPVGLCAAQWIVGVRTVTPRLAAQAGIGYRRYTAISAPTAVVWAATLTSAGYLASAVYQQVARWLGFGGLGLAAGAVVLCVAPRLRRAGRG